VIYLFRFLELLCEVLTLLILVRVVVSWVSPGQTNALTNILYQVTEPILGPLRRIIPRVGILDFTPMIAIILLQVIATLLTYLH
jgi:YggT family protein